MLFANAYSEAIDLLKELIKIPSSSGREDAATQFLQSKLKLYFPQSRMDRKGNNLVVESIGETDGPTLLLCSHLDTVEALDSWTYDPFGAQQVGDKLYGLGSNDAGASLVSLIAAMRLIGKPKAGRIILALVAEEEVGSQGFYTIEPSLPRYDAAIFGEPTNLKMATSMRGAMRLKLRSRGIGCHASVPWEGDNATDKFVQDIQALRAIDLKDDSPWGGSTIEPTLINGGRTANQIPDLIETTLDVRTTPKKNNEWILRSIQDADMEIEVLFNRRKPMFNDPQSKIVKAFQKHYPSLDECVFDGTCDMAFATAPSIILGPGELKVAHVADEYTELLAIKEAISVYKSVIETYLSDCGES